MSGPPGLDPAPRNTGASPNAETKRRAQGGSSRKVVSARVIRAMRAAGMEPHGYQDRSLVTTILANHDEPNEAAVMSALMAAPWCPKPRRRPWRLGEGGGWAVRS